MLFSATLAGGAVQSTNTDMCGATSTTSSTSSVNSAMWVLRERSGVSVFLELLSLECACNGHLGHAKKKVAHGKTMLWQDYDCC